MTKIAQPVTLGERFLFNELARKEFPQYDVSMTAHVDRWYDPTGSFSMHEFEDDEVFVVHQSQRYQPIIHHVDREKTSNLFLVTSAFNRAENAVKFFNESLGVKWRGSGSATLCVTCWTLEDCNALNGAVSLLADYVPIIIPLLDIPFSKAVGIDACIAKVTKSNTVVSLLDIDTPVTQTFLDRTYRFVIPGISFFSPVIVLQRRGKDFFAYSGTGLVSFSYQDYLEAGSYSSKWSAVTYGWEDTDLWMRLYRLPLSSVRYEMREIHHNPHDKNDFWEYHGKSWTVC